MIRAGYADNVRPFQEEGEVVVESIVQHQGAGTFEVRFGNCAKTFSPFEVLPFGNFAIARDKLAFIRLLQLLAEVTKASQRSVLHGTLPDPSPERPLRRA